MNCILLIIWIIRSYYFSQVSRRLGFASTATLLLQTKLLNKSCLAYFYLIDAWRDLVPFVQFKKRKKYPWRSATFSKVVKLLSTKFFQYLQRKKKISLAGTASVSGYDKRRSLAYKRVGWSKSGDFKRMCFLNGPLIKFYNSDSDLIQTASRIAGNRSKQTSQF